MKTILFCDNTLWGLVNFRGKVIEHFREKGYRVVLCAPEKEDKQMRVDLTKNVEFEPIVMGRNSTSPVNDLRYLRRLYQVMRRVHPDYVFTYTIKPNIYGAIVAARLGVPQTAMMAGMGYVFSNDRLSSRLARRMYKYAMGKAQHLFALNEGNRKAIVNKRICDEGKIVLLKGGEGVDLLQFPYYDNEAEGTTFVFVGRLSLDKGYQEFVEAAKTIKNEFPSTQFHIYGSLDPSYPNHIPEERVMADQNAGVIQYKGFLSDMNDLYKQRGIVITLPSYHEGMNRALMEACATGKPIITTDIPGCREAVVDGKNGYVVPPHNAEALAGAMRKYLSLDERGRKSFSQASRSHAERIFDVRDVIKVYEQILNGEIL